MKRGLSSKTLPLNVIDTSRSLSGAAGSSPCDPAVFNFYTFLRSHPLLLRRHFGSSEKPGVCLPVEGREVDSISLTERRLFFSAAHAHLQAGCPMLALEVLSKMPKVVKRSKARENRPVAWSASEGPEKQDWSQPVLNGFQSVSSLSSPREDSHSDSVLSFDWSQPSLTLQDEPLEMKWDSEESDVEESGLAMKTIHPETSGDAPVGQLIEL